MTGPRATVRCRDCDLTEAFEKLQPARTRIEAHREERGHDPYWELGELSPGVQRAGDEAGVCGRCER
ncbi:MAG: hypothetical protein ABEJ61_07250 [Haloferacaceae archaeon]